MPTPPWRQPPAPVLEAYVLAGSLRQYQTWWGITGADPKTHRYIASPQALVGLDLQVPLLKIGDWDLLWGREGWRTALLDAERERAIQLEMSQK